ncbi:MAG: hypothetical protein AAF288_08635 [Planctomycetota bacterium]
MANAKGKYGNPLVYRLAKLRRDRMRRRLAPLVAWDDRPLADDAYTLVVGCRHDLMPMARSLCRFLQAQRRQHHAQTILVFDTTRNAEIDAFEAQVAADFPELNVVVDCYSDEQLAVAEDYRLPWVYCWLSWAIAFRRATTRYVLIQDLDAYLLDPEILERSFSRIRDEGAQFLGDQFYHYNGLTEDDRVLATWELMFDWGYVRERFPPIDLFHRVGKVGARRVDFDIMLYAQLQGGKRVKAPLDRDGFVHPAQTVHEFTEMRRLGPAYPPNNWSILMIPYFFELGGDPKPMSDLTQSLFDSVPDDVPYFDSSLNLTKLVPGNRLDFLKVQIERIEQHQSGQVRESVRDYLHALEVLARHNLQAAAPSAVSNTAVG